MEGFPHCSWGWGFKVKVPTDLIPNKGSLLAYRWLLLACPQSRVSSAFPLFFSPPPPVHSLCLCMCVCLSICVSSCIFMCVYIHVHVDLCVWVAICFQVCTFITVCSYVHMCAHACGDQEILLGHSSQVVYLVH